MADFTSSNCVKNSSGTLNLLAAQASQTFDFSGQDQRFVLIAQNGNAQVAPATATITIGAGGYLQSALGSLSVDIAQSSAAKVIGPLESMRFKTTGGKLTVSVAVTQSGTVSSVKLAGIKLP